MEPSVIYKVTSGGTKRPRTTPQKTARSDKHHIRSVRIKTEDTATRSHIIIVPDKPPPLPSSPLPQAVATPQAARKPSRSPRRRHADDIGAQGCSDGPTIVIKPEPKPSADDGSDKTRQTTGAGGDAQDATSPSERFNVDSLSRLPIVLRFGEQYSAVVNCLTKEATAPINSNDIPYDRFVEEILKTFQDDMKRKEDDTQRGTDNHEPLTMLYQRPFDAGYIRSRMRSEMSRPVSLSELTDIERRIKETPLIRREWEESYLWEPDTSKGEKPCANAMRCKASRLLGMETQTDGLILKQFYTPSEIEASHRGVKLPANRVCLLCQRHLHTKNQLYFTSLGRPIDPSWVVPMFRNAEGVAGEYMPQNCMRGHSDTYCGTIDPFVMFTLTGFRLKTCPTTGLRYLEQTYVRPTESDENLLIRSAGFRIAPCTVRHTNCSRDRGRQ